MTDATVDLSRQGVHRDPTAHDAPEQRHEHDVGQLALQSMM